MYLRSCSNLSKNISIILSLGFVSTGAFASDKPISTEDIDLLTDNLLGVAQPSPKKIETIIYQKDDDGYKNVPINRTSNTVYTHSISFSGAAFRYPWHFGVAAYLQEKYSAKLPIVCFLGASAGAMVSSLLACDVKIARDVMGIAVDLTNVYKPTLTGGNFTFSGTGWLDKVYSNSLITQSTTGVYGHIFDALRATSDSYPLLPNNSALMATDRATFSLTNITSWWPKNERINQYALKNDLIDYALASGHLPFLVDGTAYATVYGQKYVDGGITDSQPVFNNETIRVWPYMGTIWGSTALSWLSLYGNSDMERNRGIYMDGYTFAKSEDAKTDGGIWAPLRTIN